MRILVVEDHVPTANLASDVLALDGHVVTSERDSGIGRRRVLAEPFDLIMCDVGVPGRDGLALAGAVRAAGIDTPMLALAGPTTDDERTAGLAAGFDRYLMKPVTARSLLHEAALHDTANSGARVSAPALPVAQPAAPPRRRGILSGLVVMAVGLTFVIQAVGVPGERGGAGDPERRPVRERPVGRLRELGERQHRELAPGHASRAHARPGARDRRTAGAVPAWVDEGLVTVVQNTALPASSAIDMGSYVALALLAEHRTTLDQLTSLDEWPMRNAALAGYGYKIGELAARELINHVSLPVLIRILGTQRSAGSFAQAYARVTGASYASFLRSFAAQIESCGQSITTGMADGARNVPYLVRGFGARRDVHIAIDGAGYHVDFSVRTDDYGLYAGTFGSTAVAGSYEIVAIDGALNARVSIDTVAGGALAPRATAFCGD